jgi:putative phosphoesterase
MRIAILSDIHGNLTALEAVVADLKQTSPDLVIHGGDLAASGHRPAEVIDCVRDLGWAGVRGNTDEMLWAPEPGEALLNTAPKIRSLVEVLLSSFAPATRHLIGAGRLAWLRELPTECREAGIVVLHASPTTLWAAPMPGAGEQALVATYGELGASTIVYGHIHRPFVRKLARMVVANTGSVGLPYDGDPRASYLLIDGDQVRVRRVEYDTDSEIRSLLQSTYPYASWLASILRSGAYSPPPPEVVDRAAHSSP